MKQHAAALALVSLMWSCSDSPASPSATGANAPPAATLSGTVFASTASGLVAIEGARVRLEYGAGTVTDQAGAYQLTGLIPGSHTVSTSKAGYEVDTRTISITGDTRFDVHMAKQLLYTLYGGVFEATPSGPVPIPGLEMYCDTCGEFGHTRTLTDADGNYAFADVPNSRLSFYISRGGYLNLRKDVTVNGNTRFDVTLEPLP